MSEVKPRSIFRSEPMSLCDFFIQPEAGFTCLSKLGEMGIVQFRDMNEKMTAFQRKYTTEIRKCDELERILRYTEKEIRHHARVSIFDAGDNPPVPNTKELNELEVTLQKLEGELKEVTLNATSLERSYADLVDMRHVLAYVQLHTELHGEPIVDGAIDDGSEASDTKAILTAADGTQAEMSLASLNYVAGVLPLEKVAIFERMLWRVARGNIYLRHATVVPIVSEVPTAGLAAMTDDEPPKEVFIAFFQGEQLNFKVKKICEAFRATCHNFPESVAEKIRVKTGIETRIADLVAVLGQTEEHRHRLLLSAASRIRAWEVQVAKAKAVYHELNKFNVDINQCLIGEGWCPEDELQHLREILTESSQMAGSSIPSFMNVRQTRMNPPTFFRNNKFTAAFQSIVHSYGVADYMEINPALYTTITFPFLFAVMFGDFGHGTVMLLAGLYLVLSEKKLAKVAKENETFGMFFGGRYIITLMGLFSIYTGFFYNDIFSKSIKIYPSSWWVDKDMPIYIDEKNADSSTMMLEPDHPRNCTNCSNWNVKTDEPYPFGLDPVWNGALNEITFVNSMKMKMSVILGIVHMFFGLSLSVGNHLHRGNYLSIFCEFVPMVLFMAGIFIYMDILIIWKWITITPDDSHCAPSILIGVINMVLFTYPSREAATCAELIFLDLKPLQIALVLIAVLSIPWLLLSKPLILWRRAVRKEREMAAASVGLLPGGSYQPPKIKPAAATAVGDEPESEIEKSHQSTVSAKHKAEEEHGEGPFDLPEEMIHQAIHTIEFCLGLVSHTASYLRLWALSLAHVELSEVLWMYLLRIPLSLSASGIPLGAIMMVPLFAGWAGLTIAILVLMEGLSAFLHALRLHWVEFQSKFYGGQGYAFTPFSFGDDLDE